MLIFEPQYFKRFRCVSSACWNTCCKGWDVIVDKATYDIYRQCQDTILKPMFDKYITLNNDHVAEKHSHVAYARVIMDNHTCPFFAEDGLCFIQKRLNKKSLSITCDTYPRIFNNVDGVLERSLFISCPAAAEIVLLNEKPMSFDKFSSEEAFRNSQIPILITTEDRDIKPYRYFHELRFFVIELLQDRSYPLWQRLIILSLFCSRLNEFPTKFYGEIPYFITNFKEKVYTGAFRNTMNDMPSRLEIQLQIIKILIDYRLQGSYVDEQFLSGIDEFKKGLEDTDNTSLETIAIRYAESYRTYYQPFMDENEYIIENYLVNYVFKNLFPLGSQKSIYFEQKSIYTEYILLVIHYSLIKALLIGISSYHKKNFNINHVLKLIQSFAKSIEHNINYLKQSVYFIESANMNNMSGMVTLIKN